MVEEEGAGGWVEDGGRRKSRSDEWEGRYDVEATELAPERISADVGWMECANPEDDEPDWRDWEDEG